jgi:uroporphyrinogen III methyltransferase/synthase
MRQSRAGRLQGRRIALTRPEERSDDLRSLLEEEGAVPIPCPTIRIAAATSYDRLDEAVADIQRYGWVAFTSANAVRAVLGRMELAGVPLGHFGATRVAAVGPATREALEARGVGVSFEPEERRAEALARTLEPVNLTRILYPRSDVAGPDFAVTLEARGAFVDDIVAYRTIPTAPPPESVEGLMRGVDAVAFTSPSTVRGFLEVGPEWRHLLRGAVVATMGPATSAAARAAGIDVAAEALPHTSEGLVEALAAAFATRPAGWGHE